MNYGCSNTSNEINGIRIEILVENKFRILISNVNFRLLNFNARNNLPDRTSEDSEDSPLKNPFKNRLLVTACYEITLFSFENDYSQYIQTNIEVDRMKDLTFKRRSIKHQTRFLETNSFKPTVLY